MAHESATPTPGPPVAPAADPQAASPLAGAAVILIAAILYLAAWSNALSDNWLSDERNQISQNQFIQEPRFYWKALTSPDPSQGEDYSSPPHWRPVCTLWQIANFRLFELSPLGWRITSLAAHFIVVMLVYHLLRSLQMPSVVSAGTTWLFAVHPVHVESVTRLAGISEVLSAILLLSACLLRLRKCRTDVRAARAEPLAWTLYLLACLSNESAAIFPAVLFALDWTVLRAQRCESRGARKTAIARIGPFLLITALFLVLRALVLRHMPTTAGPGLITLAATAPELLVHYLRQSFFPLILGPACPLRPVNLDNIGVFNFILPLGILLILFQLLRPLWHRQLAARIGLAWLFLLIPALDIHANTPEQLANNGNLHLPVLGACIIVCTAIADALTRQSRRTLRWLQYSLVLLIALGLIPLTRDYNRASSNDVALWERAVRIDARSVHAYVHLGNAYIEAGRLGEAEGALMQAADINPASARAQVGTGVVAIHQGRFDVAAYRLKKALTDFPYSISAVNALAECYEKLDKVNSAIGAYESAIKRMPGHKALFSRNIAMIQSNAGLRKEAIARLESIRPLILLATAPELYEAWFDLGELYRQEDRSRDAAEAYDQFLELSEPIDHPKSGRFETVSII